MATIAARPNPNASTTLRSRAADIPPPMPAALRLPIREREFCLQFFGLESAYISTSRPVRCQAAQTERECAAAKVGRLGNLGVAESGVLRGRRSRPERLLLIVGGV